MSTPAQIEANRINSLSSTGPRTPEGKAASSRNALSHGLSSLGDPVLPHEDREEFKIITVSYAYDFSPANSHETYLINEMVGARWRIARADRLLNIVLSGVLDEKQNEPTDEDPEVRIARMMAAKGDPIAKIERHRAVWERTYYRCMRELRAAQKHRKQNEPVSVPSAAPLSVCGKENKTNSPLPYTRPEPKIGRNDYCPCGSGLKYKKCCLNAPALAS
jgi:hypothetical protein